MLFFKKNFFQRSKELSQRIKEDDLLLLSSSISYYSALAIAPFLLILLVVASGLGQEVHLNIAEQAAKRFTPQVGDTISFIFENMQDQMKFGSLSGIISGLILLWTCSLVFLQFRYSFDVIYRIKAEDKRQGWNAFFVEKILAMLIVLGCILLIIASFVSAGYVEFLLKIGKIEGLIYVWGVHALNFIIYLFLFTALHTFAPSQRQRLGNTFKMALFTSFFFLLGNVLMGSYLKRVAGHSVFGAAGTLVVFLLWTYYSSFVVFLSVELFLFLKHVGKIKA
jgi:membrane protein